MKCTIIRKHTYIILTHLNPTFIWKYWGLQGYIITKTYLYNFDPLKPHFYIVKLGLSRVYIIFLISAQKHRLSVLVRTASARQFERVPTFYVLSRNFINIRNFIGKLSVFGGEILNIQLNLVISNSLISNYRLSRSENRVPVLTWNYENR